MELTLLPDVKKEDLSLLAGLSATGLASPDVITAIQKSSDITPSATQINSSVNIVEQLTVSAEQINSKVKEVVQTTPEITASQIVSLIDSLIGTTWRDVVADNAEEDLSDSVNWVVARDNSQITATSNNITKCTAMDNSGIFGMSRVFSGLEIGKTYRLTYSYLAGDSLLGYGRLAPSKEGSDTTLQFFANTAVNKEGSFTFTATDAVMYLVLLSNGQNTATYFEAGIPTLELIPNAVIGGGSNVSGDKLVTNKLYTQAELDRWSNRAINGPFKMQNDAYTGNRAEYKAIKGQAEMLPSTPDEDIVLTGFPYSPTIGSFTDGNQNRYNSSEQFGKWKYARDAAFIDLIEGTELYTDRVKNLLLQQVNQPYMDFTDPNYFPQDVTTGDFMWYHAEWLHRVLKAYDYLPHNVFTEKEHTDIADWFIGAADYFEYVTGDRVYAAYANNIYTYRAAEPIDSVVNLSAHHFNHPFESHSYADGSRSHKWFAPGGLQINNRALGMLNFVCHVGVKFKVDRFKDAAMQMYKEFISLYFDEEGYFSENERGHKTYPNYGLAYLGNTLLNAVEIAHILYHDEYENLFEYKSKANMNTSTGEIYEGTVEKSLDWAIKNIKANFMDPSSLKGGVRPPVYINYIVQQNWSSSNWNTTYDSTTQCHFSENTKGGDSLRRFGRMKGAIYIANRYYQDATIAHIYDHSKGNMFGFNDSDLEMDAGPNGVSPDLCFMYGYAYTN